MYTSIIIQCGLMDGSFFLRKKGTFVHQSIEDVSRCLIARA